MYSRYVKRLVDIALCLILSPIFVLLCLVIGLMIKLDDGGPVFYISDRVGKGGKLFKMYKFRSMKVGAPSLFNRDGSTFSAKDDPRVTRIGRFIRATSIDEVPQILNVLKGDMSVVGPRASLPCALGTFRNDEVGKMAVRPGITGFTQAYYRNSITNREKRLKDAWYANNVSFLLDARICLKTVQTVIRRNNLYTSESIRVNGATKPEV